MNPKVLKVSDSDRGRYIFYCPGCGENHYFDTIGKSPVWCFNGNEISPIVFPSIISYDINKNPVCHLFIRNGRIQYLKDCIHSMRGGTIEMTDMNEDNEFNKGEIK